MKTTSNPALTHELIHSTLYELVSGHVETAGNKLQPGSRLVQDLGADSLDVAELAMELEDRLDLKLPDELFEKPDLTLGEIEQELCKQCL